MCVCVSVWERTDSFTEKDRRNREKDMSRPKQETTAKKIPLQ